MNTIDEMIEVLQAVRDGKEIEYLYEPSIESCGTWKPSGADHYYLPDFREIKYRVKPQKKELWCIYVDDNRFCTFDTKEHADGFFARNKDTGVKQTIVHMVEKGE